MKDMIIGTLSGISAVIAVALLTPRPHFALPPLRELAPADFRYGSELGQEYLPATQPDPTRVKLDRTIIAQVQVKEMPFQKLVAYLSDLAGVNFKVDWRNLEAAGINADATVTLDLQGVPASVVLKAALADLGAGKVSLAYRAANGIVRISTADELAKETCTRIYDVRDIIEDALAQSRRGSKAGAAELSAEVAVEAEVRLIEEAVDPVSWRDAGGATGGIRAFAGRLIITQTPENHEQILGLLSALRRATGHPPASQGAGK